MSESRSPDKDTPKCGAQTGRYVGGVMTATWCDRPATMRTRASDGSATSFCDEHGAMTIEAGATRVAPLEPTTSPTVATETTEVEGADMSERQSPETTQRPWRAPFDSVRAEAIERIVSKLLGLACDGSETSCEDVLSGGVCPYGHAAQIVRDLSTPPEPTTSPTVAPEGDGGEGRG